MFNFYFFENYYRIIRSLQFFIIIWEVIIISGEDKQQVNISFYCLNFISRLQCVIKNSLSWVEKLHRIPTLHLHLLLAVHTNQTSQHSAIIFWIPNIPLKSQENFVRVTVPIIFCSEWSNKYSSVIMVFRTILGIILSKYDVHSVGSSSFTEKSIPSLTYIAHPPEIFRSLQWCTQRGTYNSNSSSDSKCSVEQTISTNDYMYSTRWRYKIFQ